MVLAAAAITITLAATLLTALWVYAGAASTVSVRTALGSASHIDTSLGMTSTTESAAEGAAAGEVIRASIADALDGVEYESPARCGRPPRTRSPTASGRRRPRSSRSSPGTSR